MFWRSGGPGTVSYNDESPAPVIPRAGSPGLTGMLETVPAHGPDFPGRFDSAAGKSPIGNDHGTTVMP